MVDGRSLSKISQGVTTEVMGEGWTPAPFGGRISAELPIHQFSRLLDPAWAERMPTWSHFRDWLEAMTEQGVSPNIGSFLGGGTLRKFAMGMDMRPPTAAELGTMARVTAEAMEEGAFGVSFALIYPPSSYADTEEIVAIAKTMRSFHGIYITHLRSEADAFLEGLEEALLIGRAADVPVEIYHLKAAGGAQLAQTCLGYGTYQRGSLAGDRRHRRHVYLCGCRHGPDVGTAAVGCGRRQTLSKCARSGDACQDQAGCACIPAATGRRWPIWSVRRALCRLDF